MRLLLPGPVWELLLAVFSAFALTTVFVRGWENTAVAYVVYAVSTYALTVVTARLTLLFLGGRRRLHEHEAYRRYRADPELRAKVSIRLSLAVTLFYCVIKAAAGIWYRSAWFGSMAFYYMVLAVMRAVVFRRSGGERTYRACRLCGWLLLVLTAALGVISIHTIWGGNVIRYPGFLIYAAAAFTFYNLTMAVMNVIRYRKLANPLWSVGKQLSLVSALVSLFFLENSMLTVFGDGGAWQRYLVIATAAVVFFIAAGMAVGMIRTRIE